MLHLPGGVLQGLCARHDYDSAHHSQGGAAKGFRGNLNKWINGLIEQAVGERGAGWAKFMDQPRRRRQSQADEIRKASR